MPELVTLAGCNGPQSLAFAANMPRLRTLVVESAPVTDLSPLTGAGIATLSVYGCAIADYAPLSSLGALRLLSVNENAGLPRLACRVLHRRLIALPAAD